MRWPPVIFTIGTLVLVRDVGDAAQLGRRGHAAVDARHDAEGAVLLDVGVDAVVDEARVALVLVLRAPERLEQRREPGLLPASSLPPASAANTAETLRRPRAVIASISSGLGSGTPGT